jgi:predicted PurR-regulated permease PerM
MRLETQTRFWLVAFAVFAGLVWLLKPVLLPFVAGMVIAYFLAPVVNFLAARGVPRWLGALGVLLGFGVIAAAIIMLILPLISSQIGALLNALPGYSEKVREHYLPWIENWITRFPPEDVEKLRSAAGQSAAEAAGFLGNILKSLVANGVRLIDTMAMAIVTPVVAFFTLRDWPTLTQTIDSILPRRYYDVIVGQLEEIDSTLSGFIRGQALVCLSLGIIYSVGLAFTGLQYSAAIGVTAGMLSFIPYVGTAFGWITSLILALVQFDDWQHIAMVIGVFAFGHFLEAYVLTPRLVGHRVGLHPVWILFALITGVKLMGFLGILIAVPTAAVLGVLTRFLLKQYRNSPMYQDVL